MTLKKRTIRRLTPLARDLGRLHNDAAQFTRRVKVLMEKVATLEHELAMAKADQRAAEYRARHAEDQAAATPAQALGLGGDQP